MIEFMYEWNTERKTLKFEKTSRKRASEQGYLMDNCFYKFPILFYDKIILEKTNPIYSPGHYLPDNVNSLYT